jgi:hypothetical protein
MAAKLTLLIPLATLCMIPAEFAVPAACQQGSLDGARVLTNDCGDGSCGVYQVGFGSTDLGFGGTLPDTIYFEFWPISPPPATGTFDLGSGNNSNYSTCEQCILVYEDMFAGIPQKTFFQTGGTMTIDPNTIPGTAADVGLSWSNVTLAEVTINPDTFVSTLVPGGGCYAIAAADQIFHSGFEAP